MAASATLTGDWETGDGVVQIKGHTLIGADGSEVSLTIRDGGTCAFTVNSETYIGHLGADSQRLRWSDGVEWVRKRSEVGAALSAALSERKPKISLEQALQMQKELYSAFSEQDFQDQLEEVEAEHGKGYAHLTPHHTELFLSVQNRVLPKFGYDHGPRGVAQMFQDVSRFNTSDQFQRNRFMLNQLLGLLSPEEAEESDDQDSETEGAGDRDGIEIAVHHFTENITMKVVVNAGATFSDVREAIARKMGNLEIREKGRLMRKQDGVFSAYNDTDPVGQVREVLLLQGSLKPKGLESEEQAPASRRGQVDQTRFMYKLACPPTFVAERRLQGENQGQAKEERERVGPSQTLRREVCEETLQVREQKPAVFLPVQKECAQRDRQHFLVIGGDDGVSFHNSAEILDLPALAFGCGPLMSAKRSSCAAAPMDHGQLLVIGGCVGAQCLDSTEVLDPQTKVFRPGPDMSAKRAACAAARIDNDHLIVVGGRDRSTRLDTTEVLDTTAMVFASGPRLSTRRAMCAAVALSDQQALVIGGHDGMGALDTTEVLDVKTMEFQPGPRLCTPRFSCAAVLLDDGRVLVLGGVGDGSKRLMSTEVLNLRKGTFAAGPSMGIARSGCGVMVLDEKRLLVLGGHDGSNRHDSTEVLDLSAMEFLPGPKMACHRGGCVAASW